MLKRIIAMALIVLVALPTDGFTAKKKKVRRNLPAGNAVLLWDATSNKTLFAKNSLRQMYPASTTKIMTALLVLEKLPLDKMITVSSRALQVQETKLGLKAGEQYSVRDLLYAILLKSANDAANVLAEAVGGSQSNFVVMMNARAKQLGATHTRFSNAHGLPSSAAQYTTAKDMAKIMQQTLKNPMFRRIITFKYRVIYSKDGRRHFLKSHNRSLFLNWKKSVYGKTGYTRQAQSCFVGFIKKKGHILIIAVFKSRKRWEDVKYVIERYGKVDL